MTSPLIINKINVVMLTDEGVLEGKLQELLEAHC